MRRSGKVALRPLFWRANRLSGTEVRTVMAREAVLSWFTGKALANAQGALDLLAASVTRHGWLPGASRKVRAALLKANVAINLGNRHGKALEEIGGYNTPRQQRGWEVMMLLRYGYNARAADIDFAAIRSAAPTAELGFVVDQAARFAEVMAEPFAAMDRLDATRPAPVFTSLGLSPTVSATLTALGLDGSAATLRVCQIEWVETQSVDKDGRTRRRVVGRLLWPEGTVHGASKHARSSSARFGLCEACGHAIRNPYNWLPLLVDDERGVPHSLWVGRDCARNLFGFQVTGEVELEGGPTVGTLERGKASPSVHAETSTTRAQLGISADEVPA